VHPPEGMGAHSLEEPFRRLAVEFLLVVRKHEYDVALPPGA